MNFVNEILCSLEKEGFIAHYFPGTKEKNKVVIVVGGASCNEKTSIAMSGYLRRAGYNVLVPFDYVMEETSPGNKRLHCSVYTYKGENLPFTETPMLDKGMLNWLKMAANAKGYGLKRFMRFGCDYMSDSLNPESRIKVENMNADVLLLAVKNVDCWPSDVAVPRMLGVFEKNKYPHRVESFIYEKGSHALADGIAEMNGFTKLLVNTMIPTEKKYPKECEKARQDSFARIIKFIEQCR